MRGRRLGPEVATIARQQQGRIILVCVPMATLLELPITPIVEWTITLWVDVGILLLALAILVVWAEQLV